MDKLIADKVERLRALADCAGLKVTLDDMCRIRGLDECWGTLRVAVHCARNRVLPHQSISEHKGGRMNTLFITLRQLILYWVMVVCGAKGMNAIFLSTVDGE